MCASALSPDGLWFTVQWIPDLKRSEREADHPPPTIAEVKNELGHAHAYTPPTYLHGLHRDTLLPVRVVTRGAFKF